MNLLKKNPTTTTSFPRPTSPQGNIHNLFQTPVNVAFPKKAVQSGTCAKKGKASVAKIMLTFKNITFTWSFNVEKDNSWTTQSMHVFVNLKNNTLFPQAAHGWFSIIFWAYLLFVCLQGSYIVSIRNLWNISFPDIWYFSSLELVF